MKDGRISEQGTYHELLAQEGEFAEFLVNYLAEEGGKSELDPQTETELEDLKSELEKAMGKEKLERHISVAKSARVSLKTETSNIAQHAQWILNEIENTFNGTIMA